MNKAHVAYTPRDGKIKALSEHSENILSACKGVTIGYFVIDGIRDPKTHRKYFQMLALGYDNQSFYKSKEDFRDMMQMKAGYFRTVPTEKGTVLYLPNSISYDKLDEPDFREVYSNVLDQVIKTLDVDRANFEETVMQLIKFDIR